jgi:hypothetical protein
MSVTEKEREKVRAVLSRYLWKLSVESSGSKEESYIRVKSQY